jgi:filamentous hemagglutinin family protein
MKYIFVRPQPLISIVTNISHNSSLELLVRSISISLGLLSALTLSASAQITATTGEGSTGTTVAPGATANTIDIQGGQKSGGNTNLFHSFGTFNVKTGEVANFKPDAGIQNILGRVTGGAPSLVDGRIQVTSGNPATAVNLFLMNPAGIVFGKGASLDINGAFTATTAKAIGFDNGQWFNALGGNNYPAGNPVNFAFTNTPGSIFNAATLKNAKPGQNITLVGGTVISTGDIITQGGKISIATAQSGKYVQISADGNILRLDLPIETNKQITASNSTFIAPTLSELLTGKTTTLLPIATGVTVDSNNVVKLVGDNRSILPGDIVTQKLNTSGIPNGGSVSLNTQAGDILVNSIDTSSQAFVAGGGNGGNAIINAGGLFRATGFTDFAGNVSATDKNGNPVKNSGVSIFTGGNRDFNVDEKDLRGGKINITYQGKSFLTGGEAKIPTDPNSISISVILNPEFVFPEGASGTAGAIISRNSNGSLRVVLKDGAFTNQDGTTAGGFGITGGPVIPRGGDGQTSNPDQQASRPKSKENCTPSSTSVASNPTAAPTRSAGNNNSISADPCQPSNSNNEILQILTDRN